MIYRLFFLSALFLLAACDQAVGLCDPNYIYEGVIFDVTILSDGKTKLVRLEGGAGGSAGAIGVIERKRFGNELNILIHNTCETKPYRETSIDIIVEIDEKLSKISNGKRREIVWSVDEIETSAKSH